ncbi:response regulator [Halorubrum sp. Boch-26]|uniref:response regulator n=1 Tax=Halorubrum sp. Boch-26 TaxID=2994426 RepID=UPI002468FE38|nr:response regulator [Halorubrum sp. Boch-26]
MFAIEDNPADIRLVREGVDAADIELALHVLNSGQQAADKLTAIDADSPEDHPDLILLDLNLPGKSGFDLLEVVRNESAFRDVPVVIVSSSENPDDINRSYELSANAYITKPTDPDDYIEMIDATVNFWVVTATRSTANE